MKTRYMILWLAFCFTVGLVAGYFLIGSAS